MLEIIVAGFIFMMFLTSFTSLWISTNKQFRYAVDRAKTSREAYVTRTFLTTDLATATNVTILEPDASFIIAETSGSSVTYTLDGRNLARFETVSDSSMTVAKNIASMSAQLAPFIFDTSIVFTKDSTDVTVNARWDGRTN